MLISEMVSMLAMSRLIPTVTGPSRNKEETNSKLLDGSSIVCSHTAYFPPFAYKPVLQCVSVSVNASM